MSELDPYRETYAIVAARRMQFDQLVWQVPVLSLTAQAFLFSIALSPDTTRTARVIACLLSFLTTALSMHLMVKHRQAEIGDSEWLEAYERQLKPPLPGMSWPMHGGAWASYRRRTDPKIGWPGFARRIPGFHVWIWGLALFGVAAIFVLLLALFWPELLGSS
jgi:hypothetical protein